MIHVVGIVLTLLMTSNLVSMVYHLLRDDGQEFLDPEDVDQLRQPVAEQSFSFLTWFDAGVGYILVMIAQSIFLALALWQFIIAGSTGWGYVWGAIAFVFGASRSLFDHFAVKMLEDAE